MKDTISVSVQDLSPGDLLFFVELPERRRTWFTETRLSFGSRGVTMYLPDDVVRCRRDPGSHAGDDFRHFIVIGRGTKMMKSLMEFGVGRLFTVTDFHD